jgi:hypothetical protein
MMRSTGLRWIILCALGAVAHAACAADDPCASFGWDIGRERALFAGVAQALPAGKDAESAPELVPDKLYEIALTPHDQVKFSATPGKRMPVDGASAGLAHLHLTSAGDYRISLDQGFWIDVVSQHQLVASKDFQGRHGCQTPHKIVLYSLPAGQDLILQFSGANSSRLRVAITPVAAVPTR